MRAIVVGDPPLGIIGIAYEGPTLKAFAQTRPGLDKRAAVEAMRIFSAMIAERGIRPFAVVDPTNPAAARRVKRLGFEFLAATKNGDIYRCR